MIGCDIAVAVAVAYFVYDGALGNNTAMQGGETGGTVADFKNASGLGAIFPLFKRIFRPGQA